MVYLNEYERLGHLGKGANAKVYKVRHIELGYIRAIRELTDYIEDENDKLYKSFLEECKILLKLGNGGHPNIVRIYQPRLLEHTALVEMDYVKGCNMDDFLKKNSRFIPFDEVRRFILDISSALTYCHVDIYEFLMDREDDNLLDDPNDGSKVLIDEPTRQRLVKKYGITHNDIHSKNIMRKYDGSYILLDFGLAIQNGKAVKSSSRRDGAVEYKAPEKWDNDSIISEQSDVYGFGILMYEMLAGQVPFPYDPNKYSNELQSLNELREQHIKAVPPAIESLRRAAYEAANPGKTYTEDYPGWLVQVIMKCLEKKPENRYANAKELYEEVKKNLLQTTNIDKEEVNKLEKQNAALGKELSKLLSGNKELTEEINLLQKQLSQEKNNSGLKELEAEALKQEKNEAEKLIKDLRKALENTSKDAEKTRDILKKVQAENADLQKNLYMYPAREPVGNNNTTFAQQKAPTSGLKSEYPAEPEMVFVKGGTFTMGCTNEQGSDCYSDERPLHSVTVSGFSIGKYEVTQAQWQAIMGSNPSSFKGENLPVEKVSWDDVQEFIRKLNAATGKNYRLPTEAEWEYAARGGSQSKGYKYSGSNNISDVAWFYDNSGNKTHPVGTKKPNELGIYDMSGNVWEWCSDWYGDYSNSSQANPSGPSLGSGRVLRGGGWGSDARRCRVSDRNSGAPGRRFDGIGFRLVLPL